MAEDYLGVPGLTAESAISMADPMQAEGLPRIITGSKPKPRGKSGMTIEKEQAIAARKLREQGDTPGKKVVSTYTDSQGQQVAVFDDGTTLVIGMAEDKIGERKSAFDILKEELTRYGLGDLIEDTLTLAQEGVNPDEFALRLRQTTRYKDRFKANDDRLKAGLRALSEAEYVGLEDQYQRIMRQYGLPKSFYSTGTAGRQPGLEKFISGDVSPAELEDRVQLAVDRVTNAPASVLEAMRQYYPGITQGDIIAYTLDPERALPVIKRQIQAAEIGAAAKTAGLGLGAIRAEELAARGITQEQAQQGYQAISEILPRGEQLSKIYGQEPYSQTTAEQEIFGLEGAASARRKRRQLGGLEESQFQRQSGLTAGALETGRAGAF